MDKKKIASGAVAFGAIVVAPFTMASMCGTDAQQSGPDPAPANVKPVQIHAAYGLPDGFRNVVEFCDDGGNMILVTSRGSDLAGGQNGGGLTSSVTVIPGDRRCAR